MVAGIKNILKGWFCLELVRVMAIGAFANEDGGPDSFQLDFSKLWNAKAVTPSRHLEDIFHAPGIVSVMTAEEIKLLGANTLWELLDRLPGVQSVFSSSIDRVTIRGGDPNVSMLHVLLLIDGHPVRVSAGNFAIYNPFKTFPINYIEQIEIVRGPGSVLYGTNAMEGVINIITKDFSEDRFDVALTLGANSTSGTQATFGHRRGPLNLTGGIMFLDSEGWRSQYTATGGFSGVDEVVNTRAWENQLGIQAKLTYKNFVMSGFFGRYDQNANSFHEVHSTLSFASKIYQINLTHQVENSGAWNIKTEFTYNREWDAFYVGGETPFPEGFILGPAISQDTMGGLSFSRSFGSKADLQIGTTYNDHAGDNQGGVISSSAKFSDFSISAYAQAAYRVTEQLKATAGLQLNKPEHRDLDVVPRLGLAFDATARTGLKVLYGRAYRAPVPLELYLDTAGTQKGNPNLRPEYIDTFDLQFFYKNEAGEGSLSLFESKKDDLIRLIPTEEYSVGEFTNTTSLKSRGIEFEAKYVRNPWYILGHATYQNNEDEQGAKDLTLAPTTTAMLGVGFQRNTFSYGLTDNYHDGYKEISDIPRRNPPSMANHIISGNISYGIEDWPSQHSSLKLKLSATNLLDEEIYVPDFLYKAVNTISAAGGRRLFFTLKFSY